MWTQAGVGQDFYELYRRTHPEGSIRDPIRQGPWGQCQSEALNRGAQFPSGI